jgi:acyl-CoA synthetase (AMP-forming)/AMP-acid ligase II
MRSVRGPRRKAASVKAKLLPYKYPREVRFVDELPKTGTGQDRSASAVADLALHFMRQ